MTQAEFDALRPGDVVQHKDCDSTSLIMGPHEYGGWRARGGGRDDQWLAVPEVLTMVSRVRVPPPVCATFYSPGIAVLLEKAVAKLAADLLPPEAAAAARRGLYRGHDKDHELAVTRMQAADDYERQHRLAKEAQVARVIRERIAPRPPLVAGAAMMGGFVRPRR